MRLLNQVETVEIPTPDGRHVEALVRVSGIDARAGGRGFVFERHDPVAVVVRGPTTMRRIAFPRSPLFNMALAFLAAPVASQLVAGAMRRRTRAVRKERRR